MSAIIIEDIREYVFPIFSVVAEGNSINLNSRQYLGTGFFVTKRGDAITADHVLPDPSEIGVDRRLIAMIESNGASTACWINKALKVQPYDMALFQVNLSETKYLPISTDPVEWGADVRLLGVPNHEIWRKGKEMRLLKGHVTLSHRLLELNIPVPAGMSGSPVFWKDKVVAYATGTVRSEEIEEAYEELTKIENGREIIKTLEVRRALHYGLAHPFSLLKDFRDPTLEGMTLVEFIARQNDEP